MSVYDGLTRRKGVVLASAGAASGLRNVAVPLFLLAVLLDIGLIVSSSAVATAVYTALSGVSVDYSRSRESALAISALFVTLSIWDGSYRLRNLGATSMSRTTAKWAVSIILFLVIAFLFKTGAYYSRGTVLVLAPIGVVSLLTGRQILSRLAIRAFAAGYVQPLRTAVLGAPGDTESLVREQLGQDPHVRLTTFLGFDDADDGANAAMQAIALSQSGAIDQILIALPWTRMAQIDQVVAQLRAQALPVLLMPDLQTMEYISRPTQLGPLPAFELKRAALGTSDLVLKRLLDLSVAGLALLLLWPILLIAAIAIKLESPGPVIFRQRRHGFNNREFEIFKFRSMRVMENGDEVRQATRNDDRITKVGAILRRTSIDELPQLFNVLRGEMSIVGPRPHAVAHNDAWATMVEGYARRHHILPGITGLAQVQGFRGQTETPEKIDARVKLDLAYIEKWSLALDLRIIVRTALVIFSQDEAF